MRFKSPFKNVTNKHYFNIPNLLGIIRILMIPLFLFMYLNAKTNIDYLFRLMTKRIFSQ